MRACLVEGASKKRGGRRKRRERTGASERASERERESERREPNGVGVKGVGCKEEILKIALSNEALTSENVCVDMPMYEEYEE